MVVRWQEDMELRQLARHMWKISVAIIIFLIHSRRALTSCLSLHMVMVVCLR